MTGIVCSAWNLTSAPAPGALVREKKKKKFMHWKHHLLHFLNFNYTSSKIYIIMEYGYYNVIKCTPDT